MRDLQFKNYGFSYQYDGHEFSFIIIAASEEEAKLRHVAMLDAIFVGEVKSDKTTS